MPKRFLYLSTVMILVASSLIWWRPHASATTDTFTTSGTWTVPAGVSSADFEAWGGGGAGGGASTSSTGGGGGAGGQYAIKSGFSVTPGDNYTITVATSVVGSAGANGSPGNPSFVINPSSTTIVSASGGTGGIANNGAGGSNISTGCIGDTLGGASCYLGGSGAAGSGSSGGGGGGAGSTGAGGNASGTTAGSGTSTNGGNGGTGNPSGTSAAGQAGLNYGGGGSGGVKRNGSSIAGGAGAQGLVTVTYTANSAPSSPTLTAPSSGATGVSTTPTFSFNDTDPESDDIQFKVNLFQSNCTTSVTTYDMASGQTGWSPTFNGSAGSGLTYTNTTSNSGVSFTPSSALSNSTTYCWSVSAKDPGGSNSTTTSSTQSFTTASSDQVNIGGGVNITGGTNIY